MLLRTWLGVIGSFGHTRAISVILGSFGHTRAISVIPGLTENTTRERNQQSIPW